ncbi:hypothetical protein PoB_005738700 [Plakobranchus ocellatus]|uniref:Uncharacterized protein n=1 Tax=Plakobranchus ocellatus TaxID=259542 RepID=A0AAV4CH21_9GAST|nr:hypothetical protein PoB_005738700 [Plakobranchus ocellatus]
MAILKGTRLSIHHLGIKSSLSLIFQRFVVTLSSIVTKSQRSDIEIAGDNQITRPSGKIVVGLKAVHVTTGRVSEGQCPIAPRIGYNSLFSDYNVMIV